MQLAVFGSPLAIDRAWKSERFFELVYIINNSLHRKDPTELISEKMSGVYTKSKVFSLYMITILLPILQRYLKLATLLAWNKQTSHHSYLQQYESLHRSIGPLHCNSRFFLCSMGETTINIYVSTSDNPLQNIHLQCTAVLPSKLFQQELSPTKSIPLNHSSLQQV